MWCSKTETVPVHVDTHVLQYKVIFTSHSVLFPPIHLAELKQYNDTLVAATPNKQMSVQHSRTKANIWRTLFNKGHYIRLYTASYVSVTSARHTRALSALNWVGIKLPQLQTMLAKVGQHKPSSRTFTVWVGGLHTLNH